MVIVDLRVSYCFPDTLIYLLTLITLITYLYTYSYCL